MQKRDYEVTFRKGKSITDLGQAESVRLSDYLRSLDFTVPDGQSADEPLRISATNREYTRLRDEIGMSCQILVVTPCVGGARTSGTS